MNNTEYIQKYLHEHIPLSKAMEVTVLEVMKNKVLLSAPLQPNINHRETVFGGSASALAILVGWSLVHFRLREENFDCRLVIHKNTVNYTKPILDRKSRILIAARLECLKDVVGTFEGSFVAIAN